MTTETGRIDTGDLVAVHGLFGRAWGPGVVLGACGGRAFEIEFQDGSTHTAETGDIMILRSAQTIREMLGVEWTSALARAQSLRAIQCGEARLSRGGAELLAKKVEASWADTRSPGVRRARLSRIWSACPEDERFLVVVERLHRGVEADNTAVALVWDDRSGAEYIKMHPAS